MFYILDSLGYIEEVSTHYIERDNKTCAEYTGAVPSGYDSLDDWVLNANIRAYKIENGNLVYDADRDAALTEQWAKAGRIEDYSTSEQVIGTWIDGKPLYRKVIAQNISSVQMDYTISHNIQNIDIIYVNSNSCCVSKTGDSMITTSLIAPSSYIASQAEYDYRYNNATVDKIAVGVHIGIYNHFGTATCYIILEYTKTTD